MKGTKAFFRMRRTAMSAALVLAAFMVLAMGADRCVVAGEVTVGVASFEATPASAAYLGRALEDVLSSRLSATEGLKVVDPLEVRKRLAPSASGPEQGLGGLDYLVRGQVTDKNGRVDIRVELVKAGAPNDTTSLSYAALPLGAVLTKMDSASAQVARLLLEGPQGPAVAQGGQGPAGVSAEPAGQPGEGESETTSVAREHPDRFYLEKMGPEAVPASSPAAPQKTVQVAAPKAQAEAETNLMPDYPVPENTSAGPAPVTAPAAPKAGPQKSWWASLWPFHHAKEPQAVQPRVTPAVRSGLPYPPPAANPKEAAFEGLEPPTESPTGPAASSAAPAPASQPVAPAAGHKKAETQTEGGGWWSWIWHGGKQQAPAPAQPKEASNPAPNGPIWQWY